MIFASQKSRAPHCDQLLIGVLASKFDRQDKVDEKKLLHDGQVFTYNRIVP